MTTLHPHWQATDDADDRRVHISATDSVKKSVSTKIPVSSPFSAPAKKAVAVPSASRRPAAIVGVLLCVIAGVAAFQGFNVSGSRGQVDDANTVTVHLRSTGADPVTINVQPGMTITWSNDDTIPHVLSSDTLPTADGTPFVTSAIFPGSSTHFLIPLTAPDGAYPYISKTSSLVSGQIIIHAAGTAPSSSVPAFSAPAAQTTSTPSFPQVTQAPIADTQTDTTTASVTPTETTTAMPTTTDALPVNPHTVGSGDAPLPNRQPSGVPAVTTHTPHTEAESGPEVWIVVALTLGAMLVVTRKAFRTM
jgi:plastocyanin